MKRKNLIIACVLICGIIVLSIIGIFIIMPSMYPTNNFDNSTPESAAVSIARLNSGEGFASGDVDNVYLTPDGKYWIVTLESKEKWNVTIDAKTLMSKQNDGEWNSLDELKATYIADIQSDSSLGKPQKITMNGKEIWKIPVYHECIYEDGSVTHETTYVYVDLKTGKSMNTWDEFNKAAGKKGWLTLKEVDSTCEKMDIGPSSFKDALRNLYPNNT